MKKTILLLASHAAVAAGGFMAGIYALPILMAPPPPSGEEVASLGAQRIYAGQFRRDLADSDFLHWGEGDVSITREAIALTGRLAPGPDYRLYLSPTFVETESAFQSAKPRMVEVGPVKTFENFVVPIPPGIDLSAYTTVVIWCESFGQFITAARYQAVAG